MKHFILLAALAFAAPLIQAQTATAVYTARFENDTLRKRVIGAFIIASEAINAEATSTPSYAIRQRIVAEFQTNPAQYSERSYTAVIGILHAAGNLGGATDTQIQSAITTFFTRQVAIAVATGVQ